MSNLYGRTKATGTTALVAMAAGLLLTACSSTYDDLMMDSYEPTSVEERFPIRVEKRPVKMGVVTASGTLKPDQVNAVIGFANSAKSTGLSDISVKYPSRSAKGRAAAREIANVIAGQGVSSHMIRMGSYSGGAGAPVQLSFTRNVAVTTECGDWSQNLARDPYNEPPPNFGCAMQNNIAAMVANPEDFENPRGMAPASADNRMEVMKVYLDNSTAGDYYTLGNTIGD